MIADTPMHAIRLKCLDCNNGQLYEINKCEIKDCPLWKFKSGHRFKGDAAEDNSSNDSI